VRIQSRARGELVRAASRERLRARGGALGGALGGVAPGGGARAPAAGACGLYAQSQGYPSYAQQQGYTLEQGYAPQPGYAAPQQQGYAPQLPPYAGYGLHGAHGYGGATAAWPPGGSCQPGHPVC